MSMKKQQHIKIPIPIWKWWQIIIAIVAIIIAFRADATPLLELVKLWLKSHVAG